MKQKQNIIILVALGIVFLLFWLVVITLVLKNLRGSNESNAPIVVNVTLCDVDASNLCIVNFGANNLNRMVINFRLPAADYTPFYVKAKNRETVSVYTCEADKAVQTNVYCTGVRTPLGETIDVELYSTDEDKLIAQGTFLVSAIALSTPIILPTQEPIQEAPTAISTVVPTPVPTLAEVPIPLPEDESTPETNP